MDNGLSITMLGWKAQKTTRNTFASWKRAGLAECGDEFLAFFNQVREQDREMAAEFGFPCDGVEANLGIWNGNEAILERVKGDYVVFLDDDHEAIATKEETKFWIDGALELLKSGKADTVILLNRFERLLGWGSSHFFDYHYIRQLDPRAKRGLTVCPPNWNRDTLWRRFHRLFRPNAAVRRINGGTPYLELNPERVFPRYIAREGNFFLLDSAIQPFCEAPVMMSRRFFEKLSAWGRGHPSSRTIFGHQEMEYVLNRRWWRKQHFKTAICDGGIFAHHRLDDSWRKDNVHYSAGLVEKSQFVK